jgi:hypothetical protein
VIVPRALISMRATVAEAGRDAFLSTAAAQRRKVVAAGANYWLFESADAPGQFETFVEASDRETLDQVIAAHAGPGLGRAPVFVEVKLN